MCVRGERVHGKGNGRRDGGIYERRCKSTGAMGRGDNCTAINRCESQKICGIPLSGSSHGKIAGKLKMGGVGTCSGSGSIERP